jgi:hypothetical protein
MRIRCRGNVFTKLLPGDVLGTQTHRQQGDLISLLLFFFQNSDYRLKYHCHKPSDDNVERTIQQDGEIYAVNGHNYDYFSLTILIRHYDPDSRVPETYTVFKI